MTIQQIQAAINSKANDPRQLINMIADYLQANPGGSPSPGSSYLPLDLTDDVEVALNGFALEYLGTKIKEEHDDANGIWYAEDLVNHGQYYLDGAVGTTYTQSGDPDYVGSVALVYTHPGGLAQLYSQADENNWAQLDVSGPHIHTQAVGQFNIEADLGVLLATVLEFADNAAAITGRVPVNGVYRTGDFLKIVH